MHQSLCKPSNKVCNACLLKKLTYENQQQSCPCYRTLTLFYFWNRPLKLQNAGIYNMICSISQVPMTSQSFSKCKSWADALYLPISLKMKFCFKIYKADFTLASIITMGIWEGRKQCFNSLVSRRDAWASRAIYWLLSIVSSLLCLSFTHFSILLQ